MKNSNLQRAKGTQNDEYYTKYEDVEKEVSHYKDQLRGKVIYCNCDRPDKSNFVRFFRDKFHEYGLRELICTYYCRGGKSAVTRYDGLKTKTAGLAGDGDFRSAECQEILRGADVVITNPPFSLFRDFAEIMARHNKDFVIVGNKNAITYKEVFPGIKSGKIMLGATSPKEFIMPDGSESKKVSGLCRWFTTLPHNKMNSKIDLSNMYDAQKYPKYDNYNAIEVGKVKEIPFDYDGVIGVPITFLDKYCPDQFEIVGCSESEGRGFSCGLFDSACSVHQPLVNGERKYKRIFIRKRKKRM